MQRHSAVPKTEVELAWAAGLFEGEGTIRITRPGKRQLGAVYIGIVNTDYDVLAWFSERWPGNEPRLAVLPGNRRNAWTWSRWSLDAVAFLDDIEPFVVRRTVLQKIRAVRLFQGQKRKHVVNFDATAREAYGRVQWELYEEMKALNRRGRP